MPALYPIKLPVHAPFVQRYKRNPQIIRVVKNKLERNTVLMYTTHMQLTTNSTPSNRVKLDQVETTVAELLAETLRRGFFGKAVLELTIQDGIIQCIRRVVERVDK